MRVRNCRPIREEFGLGAGVSNPETFIQEVTEAVRRDRLFALFRRWGWIGAVVVVAIVGAAAFREWHQSQQRQEAQTVGTAIVDALAYADGRSQADALGRIETDTSEAAAIIDLLAASALREAGDEDLAIARLASVADDTGLASSYRELARLKKVMLQSNTKPVAELIAELEPMIVPGNPYRLLAQEFLAQVIYRGALEGSEGTSVEQALDHFRSVYNDQQVTQRMRVRIEVMMRSINEEPEATGDG